MQPDATIRFRRRPRDERGGWEVFVTGAWRDVRDATWPAIEARFERLLEDPSERQAAEEEFPKGITVLLGGPT